MSARDLEKTILLTEHALFAVKFAAEEERVISHSKHISGFYRSMINEFESKLDAERALLKRIETVGR